jgi:YHS domain-containing protein
MSSDLGFNPSKSYRLEVIDFQMTEAKNRLPRRSLIRLHAILNLNDEYDFVLEPVCQVTLPKINSDFKMLKQTFNYDPQICKKLIKNKSIAFVTKANGWIKIILDFDGTKKFESKYEDWSNTLAHWQSQRESKARQESNEIDSIKYSNEASLAKLLANVKEHGKYAIIINNINVDTNKVRAEFEKCSGVKMFSQKMWSENIQYNWIYLFSTPIEYEKFKKNKSKCINDSMEITILSSFK